MTTDVRVVALDASIAPAWARLFDESGCPCFCRYWHFEGDKNAWLDRCANAPEQNRREQLALVASDDERARGFVALRAEAAVGWMKLVPRSCVPKLRRQSVYRALDLGPDDGVLSVGCFLVHPDHRGRGVAGALLDAAETHARAAGARAIEAYPRTVEGRVHDEQVWMGPARLFAERGYVPVAGEPPYAVVRKTW